MPTGPLQAGGRRDPLWPRRHPPSRRGGCRLAKIHRVGLAAPPPYGDADGPARFRGELEPARPGQGQAGELRHNCTEPVMAQPLLKTRKHVILVSGFDENDPVRRQSGLGKCWREHILPGQAPEHGTAAPRRNPGREEGRSRPMDRTIGPARHLMHGAQGQPAAGQAGVHLRHAKWQNTGWMLCSSFDQPDFGTQSFKGGQRLHAGGLSSKTGKRVLFMFSSC